ncbi:hypothetical protein AC1031_003383 [Aphanomyces cochlioides]|nr:hypothetical protein AC1031_003383 [Aphanomyces cochlioides]
MHSHPILTTCALHLPLVSDCNGHGRIKLALVFGGTDETQRSLDEQGDALLAAALRMSCPNGFANVLDAFHDTLHQVFTGDAVLYDHAAQLEDEFHVQVLQESQKAVYGR